MTKKELAKLPYQMKVINAVFHVIGPKGPVGSWKDYATAATAQRALNGDWSNVEAELGNYAKE